MTCGQPCYKCRCVKPEGHVDAGDETHTCDPVECGGMWVGTQDGEDWRVIAFPHIDPRVGEYEARLWEQFDAMFNRLNGRKDR